MPTKSDRNQPGDHQAGSGDIGAPSQPAVRRASTRRLRDDRRQRRRRRDLPRRPRLGFVLIFFVFCFVMGKVINAELRQGRWSRDSLERATTRTPASKTTDTGKRENLANNPEMQQRELATMSPRRSPIRASISMTATRPRRTCTPAKICCSITTARAPTSNGTSASRSTAPWN